MVPRQRARRCRRQRTPRQAGRLMLGASSGSETEQGASAFKNARAQVPRLEGETRKAYSKRVYQAIREGVA